MTENKPPYITFDSRESDEIQFSCMIAKNYKDAGTTQHILIAKLEQARQNNWPMPRLSRGERNCLEISMIYAQRFNYGTSDHLRMNVLNKLATCLGATIISMFDDDGAPAGIMIDLGSNPYEENNDENSKSHN